MKVGRPSPVALDKHIAGRLRTLRQSKAMSQDSLAATIGLTRQQVQKYECGVNRISAATLWDIAQALSVDVTEFYRDWRGRNRRDARPAAAR